MKSFFLAVIVGAWKLTLLQESSAFQLVQHRRCVPQRVERTTGFLERRNSSLAASSSQERTPSSPLLITRAQIKSVDSSKLNFLPQRHSALFASSTDAPANDDKKPQGFLARILSLLFLPLVSQLLHKTASIIENWILPFCCAVASSLSFQSFIYPLV